MASFTLSSSLASTSAGFSGTKLKQNVPRRAPVSKAKITTKANNNAEEFKPPSYVDLNDMENTTGSWSMYAPDKKGRYPALQSKFFENAVRPIVRREALFAVVASVMVGGTVLWGKQGSIDQGIPAVVGPRPGKPTETGKGGSKRKKL